MPPSDEGSGNLPPNLAEILPGNPSQPAADPHVETILQQIRSGVRQRTAEAATAGAEGSEAVRQGLLALRQREFVAEPLPFSHRASLGPLVVFVRKAVYHLFLKWHARPVLEQQNGFNQAASRLLQDLIEAEERSDRERRELAGRVAALERRLESPALERRLESPALERRLESPDPAAPGSGS